MRFRVILSKEARQDLSDIEDYIAERSGEERAEQFASAIIKTCLALDTFPQRGSVKPGGFRVIGHRRRTNILFRIDGDMVTIIGIHYGGRVKGRRADLSIDTDE